ncbi:MULTISPECIES: YiiX/YebB-like N1pC/P60 family cysteine hydrolase [unclassified Helicobacter]|uniref:YiiX/YebB-like N1pC/P60 family cysteine hydrolase n=1 Tax=unclassified Helicobacter TaxID=2593540 RepID=UPI0015F12E55|nr:MULTISPECIES: YiiX/YebB-like N1pC/P60 family cysteine hydrolase [unclassified Helicobacter]
MKARGFLRFLFSFKKPVIIGLFVLGICFICFGALYFSTSINSQNTTDELPAFSTSQAVEILSQNAESGDFILRKGRNTESVVIARLSDSLFSHIGMVVSTNPFLIIHATTDDNPNFPNQVIISPLEEFLEQGKVFALLRLKAPQSMREMLAMDSKEHLHRAFVLDTSDSRLYCTSFLETLIAKHMSISLPYTQISAPIISGEYLFPQAFYENSDFEKIVLPFRLVKENF